MKKSVFSILMLLLLCSVFVVAQANGTNTTTSTTSSSSTDSLGDFSKAYVCLEEKAGSSCENLDTIAELSFAILATPDNIMDDCVSRLESKRSNGHYGSIKDTALATLALRHAGEDVSELISWLTSQKRTPNDLIWFLQQDSNGAASCTIDDGDVRYDVLIDENKKISSDAGTCLTRAQSNFWLRIDPSCYTKRFKISCDVDFISNLLYKHTASSTIYVLDNTQSAASFGVTEHNVSSTCLGTGNTCDYEGTLWGAIALKEADLPISDLLPYIIAGSELHEQYLPDSFLYLLTGYNQYGTDLIKLQRFGSYWEAENSPYNRYYDTSLALLALGVNGDQTSASKDWLLFEQGQNGCWNNKAFDTAVILYSVLQRDYYVEPTTVFCEEAGFFCINSALCSGDLDVGDNYYCSGLSNTCCTERVLDTCSNMNGQICPTGQQCNGLPVEASDTATCCLSTCSTPAPALTECESQYYSCYDSCGDGLDEISYSCNGGQVCCKAASTTSSSSDGFAWWIWVLIIAIVALLIGIVYYYRSKIPYLNKLGHKDDDEDSSQPNSLSGSGPPSGGRPLPPRRGFPPGRRPMFPPRGPRGSRPPMRRPLLPRQSPGGL